MSEPQNATERPAFQPGSDTPFLVGLGILGGSYAIIILAMILADLAYVDQDSMLGALRSPEIHYSIVLSLLSCTLSTILSLWVAVPLGYLTSRFDFPGKRFLDTVLDIPIVLPPLVIGISLLALFNFAPFSWTSEWVVFEIPAVILAQFMVACAFATRAIRISIDQIPQRYEKVALTLGCNRGKAFRLVVMPQAKQGIVAAGTLAWARSLGERRRRLGQMLVTVLRCFDFSRDACDYVCDDCHWMCLGAGPRRPKPRHHNKNHK